MTRPRILVDVDGVLADFVGKLCERLMDAGFYYSPEDFTSWDLSSALTPIAEQYVRSIMKDSGFVYSVEWYPGAQFFLHELTLLGDVYAVTAPYDASETWERERKTWLSRYIDRKRVLPISGEEKRVVRGTFFIEDHPGNAVKWLDENKDGLALLFDRPWNGVASKEYTTHQRMIRVFSYEQAKNIIKDKIALDAKKQVAA